MTTNLSEDPMSACGCEGSCPVCRVGEVSDHKCNKCGAEFCPRCHGVVGAFHLPVDPCFCPRDAEGRPRKGDWMQTYTGRAFWPLDPRADEVSIEDIAHSLSLQCRFAGHSLFHYSVAQHSVLVAQASGDSAVWGLLHDAAEAYVVDLPRPVKGVVQGYREAENKVLEAVAEHFGLTLPIPEIVWHADNTALATEKRDVMDKCRREWSPLPDPWPARIERWQPRVAELEFLQMAVKLKLKGAVESLRVMA